MLGAEQCEVDFSISDSHIAADLDRTFKEGEKTNTAGLEQSKRMKVKSFTLSLRLPCPRNPEASLTFRKRVRGE